MQKVLPTYGTPSRSEFLKSMIVECLLNRVGGAVTPKAGPERVRKEQCK
jgi:hypothetical protein